MLLLLLLFCYLCDDNVVVGAVDGKCVAVAVELRILSGDFCL